MRYVCPLNQNKIDKAQGGKERAQLQLKLENMNEKLWWFEKKTHLHEQIYPMPFLAIPSFLNNKRTEMQ